VRERSPGPGVRLILASSPSRLPFRIVFRSPAPHEVDDDDHDENHDLIEDIKRKSFTGSVRLTDKQVTSTTFMATFVRNCERTSPLMRFLASAAGVEW
jgi:uncharacterized protein (DUF2461 family)